MPKIAGGKVDVTSCFFPSVLITAACASSVLVTVDLLLSLNPYSGQDCPLVPTKVRDMCNDLLPGFITQMSAPSMKEKLKEIITVKNISCS
jgi:hypothetical protein